MGSLIIENYEPQIRKKLGKEKLVDSHEQMLLNTHSLCGVCSPWNVEFEPRVKYFLKHSSKLGVGRILKSQTVNILGFEGLS